MKRFLFFGFLFLLLFACSPSPEEIAARTATATATAIATEWTQIPIAMETATQPPTATLTPMATLTPSITPTLEPTELPGSELVPLKDMAQDIPWLPLNKNADPGTWYVGFNTTKAPFDNPKVRQAFALAVDRSLLVAMAKNQGRSNPQAATIFTPPGILGRDLFGQVGLPYDPTNAKTLLTEAGFSDISSFPKVTLITPPSKSLNEMAWAIVKMWKDTLGVSVQVKTVDNYLLFFKTTPNLPELYLLGWVADYSDPDNFLNTVWHSSAKYNYANFSNTEFDRLVEQAAENKSDPALRQQLYIQAERILCEQQAAIIPLFHFVTVY